MGEAAWLLLLCDGPDQPQPTPGEDKDLRGSPPSSGWCASPALLLGHPLSMGWQALECRTVSEALFISSSFFFFYSREYKIPVGLFVFTEPSVESSFYLLDLSVHHFHLMRFVGQYILYLGHCSHTLKKIL